MSAPAYRFVATPLPGGEQPQEFSVVDGRLVHGTVPGALELFPPGGFVAPGLVDAHTHIHYVERPGAPTGRSVVDANRREHLLAGTMLLRDMGATSEDVLAVRDDDGLPPVQAAGRCLLVEDQFPFQVTAARELPAAIVRQAEQGARWVKIFADWPGWSGTSEEPPFGPQDRVTYPVETLVDAVKAARGAGVRVAIHAFGGEAARAGIEAGVDSIEHGFGLDEDAFEAMAARGIAWVPMFCIIAPMRKRAVESPTPRPEQAAWLVETLGRMRRLVPRAHALGVPILTGTDWFPGVTLADEVVMLGELGLGPREAIAAATTVPRRFFGVPALEDGAPADLLLYREDPRARVRRLGRPDVIVFRGRVIDARRA